MGSITSPADAAYRALDMARVNAKRAEADRARLNELGETVVGMLAVVEMQRAVIDAQSIEVQDLKDRALALEGPR